MPLKAVEHWKGRSRCCIITVIGIVVVVAVAVGVGVGVGVGRRSGKREDEKQPSYPPPAAAVDNSGVKNLTIIKNKLLEYVPVDIKSADTNELLESYLMQVSRIQPVTQILSYILPIMGFNDTVVQPQAIQMLVQTWLEDNKVDSSSLAATIDNLAQLAQGVPDFQAKLLPIADNLRNVTVLALEQLDKAYNVSALLRAAEEAAGVTRLGRRRLAAHRRVQQEADAQALIKQAVQAALASPAAAPFVSQLSRLYDPACLPDLVSELVVSLRALAASNGQLLDFMERLDSHLDISLMPSLPIYDPRTASNTSVLADTVPYDKRTTFVTPSAAAFTSSNTGHRHHRRLLYNSHDSDINGYGYQGRSSRSLQQELQALDIDGLQSALLLTKLPADFKPAPGVQQPKVLVPLVFHILTYSIASGGYGPPNWDKSPDFITRIVEVVNAMAYRSNFAFFVNEARYDPTSNPYLLKASRADWSSCSSNGNYFYKACAAALNGAKDYPRSVNVFVSGDKAGASYAGYGWVPSSPSDVSTGHVALLWAVVDAGQWNSRAGWEYGGKVLWHELMHHLGLYHTFGRSNSASGCNAGNDDGVPDTPIVAGPVYNQAFSQAARTYCLDYFSGQLGSNWDAAIEAWRTRLGIPAGDSNHGFDSCPSLPGSDELGNYITYTHDVCIAALGHFTAGQVAYLHNATERFQNKLYQWGQYFATLEPSMFAASPPPPLPPPPPSLPPLASPPPPPPPPDLSPCMRTRGGCRCRPSWSYGGRQQAGCANPDGDATGLWCHVEQDGSCPSAINGYWDYCDAAASVARCAPLWGASPPASPPPLPAPPTQPCGPGWTTASGALCARDPWVMTSADGEEVYDNKTFVGCANPDNDPLGSWCRLQPGFTTLLGRNWDYCGSACPSGTVSNPTNTSTTSNASPPTSSTSANSTSKQSSSISPPPSSSTITPVVQSAAVCSASQGLPAGCACRETWGVVLHTNGTAATTTSTDTADVSAAVSWGRRYTCARHCTVFPELQTLLPKVATGSGGNSSSSTSSKAGLCSVTGCNDARFNGRVMVCTAPCTTITADAGEDVRL